MPRTLEAIDDVISHLRAHIPDMDVDYYPDSPDTYRLNHPTGALLIGYPGSAYQPRASMCDGQERNLTLSIVIVTRSLMRQAGGVDRIDQVVDTMRGFKPPSTTRAFWIVRDRFITETAGLWQYSVDVASTQRI